MSQDAGVVEIVERVIGLHPGRRAPWAGEDLDARVETEHHPQRRQDVRLVVRDREVASEGSASPAGMSSYV